MMHYVWPFVMSGVGMVRILPYVIAVVPYMVCVTLSTKMIVALNLFLNFLSAIVCHALELRPS